MNEYLQEGQEIHIPTGIYKDFSGVVTKVDSYEVSIEIELFGRKTLVTVPIKDFYPAHEATPPKGFNELIQEFDALYKSAAPLRYQQLQGGIAIEDIEKIKQQLHVDWLPEEYIKLYTWKNGMNNPDNGWKNEFEEDSWYELIPLNQAEHWVSIEQAEELINRWVEIDKDCRKKGQTTHWKKGFIPLLMTQNWGLTVIDTEGYFGGQKGQVLFFDYQSAPSYNILHQSICKWLETCIVLLQEQLFFGWKTFEDEDKTFRLEGYINDDYVKKFPLEIEDL